MPNFQDLWPFGWQTTNGICGIEATTGIRCVAPPGLKCFLLPGTHGSRGALRRGLSRGVPPGLAVSSSALPWRLRSLQGSQIGAGHPMPPTFLNSGTSHETSSGVIFLLSTLEIERWKFDVRTHPRTSKFRVPRSEFRVRESLTLSPQTGRWRKNRSMTVSSKKT